MIHWSYSHCRPVCTLCRCCGVLVIARKVSSLFLTGLHWAVPLIKWSLTRRCCWSLSPIRTTPQLIKEAVLSKTKYTPAPLPMNLNGSHIFINAHSTTFNKYVISLIRMQEFLKLIFILTTASHLYSNLLFRPEWFVKVLLELMF